MKIFQKHFNIKLRMKLHSIIFFIPFTALISSYTQAFDNSFSEIYHFPNTDSYTFLLNQGINVDENILHLSELKRIKKKPTGNSKGGIYRDSDKTIYYVKQCRIFNEIICSRLMNLLVGTETTPIVKIIKNHKRMVASRKIESFRMERNFNTDHKTILNEVELQIAMDYLGVVDRHPKNMGYVRLNSHTLLASRVDFDSCFDFESKKGYTSKSDHLSLKHLHRSIKKYSKDEIVNAIRKIVEIPDEKIVMSIYQSWATLSRSDSKIKYERCFALAQKLIERKNVFREILENPNHPICHLLNKNDEPRIKRKRDAIRDFLRKFHA